MDWIVGIMGVALKIRISSIAICSSGAGSKEACETHRDSPAFRQDGSFDGKSILNPSILHAILQWLSRRCSYLPSLHGNCSCSHHEVQIESLGLAPRPLIALESDR